MEESKAARKKASKRTGFLDKLTAAGNRMAFAWKIREALYRHMSTQIGNGITVENALDAFRIRLQRRKKVSSDKVIGEIAKAMRNGSSFAGALAPWAPSDEVGIISSGELSGNMPKSLDLVIEAKRRVARVNSALKSSMISPAIYTAAMYGMVWGIGRYVTPGLKEVLSADRAQGLVSVLYTAGDLANSLWAILPPVFLIGAFFAVIRSFPTWTGKNRILAEAHFPYSFYRDIQGYTWLMSFSSLLRAGMADVEILKRQAAEASPWLRERLAALWWRMDNGASLPDALLAKGRTGTPSFGFPNPEIVDDISSMSGFSDFSEKISILAIQWADDLEKSTLAGAKTFGFIMEIAMFFLMGVLMVAINSMSTQMGNIPGVS